MVPNGKDEPEAYELEIVGLGSALSVTETFQEATAWQLLPAFKVKLVHPVICGAVVSFTVTLKEQLDVFPAASFA